MPSQELNFVYQLDGDLSQISVFDLAPTLLEIGELLKESNRELFPEGWDLGINVKPFRKGSFGVDFVLFAQSNYQAVLEVLTPHSIDQVKSLLESIGLIGGAAYGAIKAIRHLGGKPKKEEEVAPGEFKLTGPNGSIEKVDKSTRSLLMNQTVVNHIHNIYVNPMSAHPDVKDVKTYLKGEESAAVRIRRDEIPAFRELVTPSDQPTSGMERTNDVTHRGVLLNPKRGAFGGDPKDWSFWKGGEVITATIRDKDFLQKCERGEYRLNRSDLLTVDLLEKQKIIGTIVQKPVYEILKVTHYTMADGSGEDAA